MKIPVGENEFECDSHVVAAIKDGPVFKLFDANKGEVVFDNTFKDPKYEDWLTEYFEAYRTGLHTEESVIYPFILDRGNTIKKTILQNYAQTINQYEEKIATLEPKELQPHQDADAAPSDIDLLEQSDQLLSPSPSGHTPSFFPFQTPVKEENPTDQTQQNADLTTTSAPSSYSVSPKD